MKAIIPVAGAGTKLRPHTYTQPKALIPVAGKPILTFIIEELLDAGVTEFVFVVGYLGDKIRDFVAKNFSGLRVQFVEQEQREGVGHAIWLTRELVGDEEIFIILGDSIYDINLKDLVFADCTALGVKKVEDPRTFGVAEVNSKDEIVQVVEKPQIPTTNMALVGLYKIKNAKALFEALKYNIENNVRTQNEIQLTDAIQRMIDQGEKVKAFKVNNWFDCGKKTSLLETNAMLLKKTGYASKILPFFENTIIIDPVSLATDCEISNSIVGPNVTIGEKSVIKSSIITDSIIGSYANLENVLLKSSIIGSDASIRGAVQSLNAGDDSEIDLG